MPKYYEISEAAAKRAKDMNSFSDYAPGSATAGYRARVDEAYVLAEKQKAQVDPMYHDKIDALVDCYARRLAENLNERNAIDARVPSILITGGSNFPVAKKAKQNAARDRNYGEYAEIEKLLDKIRSTGRGGISADDDLAVEKLTKKAGGNGVSADHDEGGQCLLPQAQDAGGLPRADGGAGGKGQGVHVPRLAQRPRSVSVLSAHQL